jgi:hypothetical protein
MLSGMESNRIIVGAYVDRSGGVCPMLAAHRNGGRTSVPSFARAWDRYTRARRPRPATERELRTLRTMLEASVALDEPGHTELSQAIVEHQRVQRGAAAKRVAAKPEAAKRSGVGPEQRAGEPDRAAELAAQEGWAWTRPFRRLDDFELTVRELRAIERERERRREPEPV